MIEPLQTNAADEQQVAHAGRVTKARRRRSRALWRQLLSTPDGREWVWEVLLPELGLFESGITLDPHQLFALEGRREVGRRFYALLTTEYPEKFLEAQAEAMERATRQERENQAARVRPATDNT